jgi:tripartite-type tricarboxylate transporter receptor subunit TctC
LGGDALSEAVLTLAKRDVVMGLRAKVWGVVTGALAAALTAPLTVQAAYPDHPITLIVAYEAGTPADVAARLLAPFLEKRLDGARVEVVNKPGAGGEVGFAALTQAIPDGYTIGLINTPNIVTIPIERQARFALSDLDPLVNLIDDPAVWLVPADSPFVTVADVVAQAKAAPGAVTVGTTGAGSDDHLALLMVQRQAEASLLHVPFSNLRASQKALLGRKIQIDGQSVGDASRLATAEPVRVLGVMSRARTPSAPDVKTFAEQGFPVVMGALRGIGAPKGLPPDVRARLVEAITKAAEEPDFRAKAEAKDSFQPLRLLSPEAFAAELAGLDGALRALWRISPWLR